jgi:hypothetical protein
MHEETAYNPLDKKNLGHSVVEALLARPVTRLDTLERFKGAGIYAIYYTGDFPPYAPLVAANRKQMKVPIYVGKAVPKGSRKGLLLESAVDSPTLHGRLRDHCNTIQAAANLSLGDFHCRYLLLDEIWIPLGESLVIQRYNPLWNVVLEGFGNHMPGQYRPGGKVSSWDSLHPGRSWTAQHQVSDETRADLLGKVAAHLASPGRQPG